MTGKFADKLEQLTQAIRPLVPMQPSKKHIHSQNISRQEPTPALKYRGLEVQVT